MVYSKQNRKKLKKYTGRRFMTRQRNLDKILFDWPYDANTVNVKSARGDDRRQVLLMRVDMGVLQIETAGRPDGERPFGFNTYYDYLLSLEKDGDIQQLDADQCIEVDREFVQFYHRRICWLSLRDFEHAVQDADHTLALMDFCLEHSPDEDWTITHEQYRPFVLFHRTQAAALAKLEEDSPDNAIQEVNRGLERLEDLYVEHEAEEEFEDDELVQRLTEFRESLREHFEVGRTLQEQLDEAVAREQYELAAKLRDEIARKKA